VEGRHTGALRGSVERGNARAIYRLAAHPHDRRLRKTQCRPAGFGVNLGHPSEVASKIAHFNVTAGAAAGQTDVRAASDSRRLGRVCCTRRFLVERGHAHLDAHAPQPGVRLEQSRFGRCERSTRQRRQQDEQERATAAVHRRRKPRD